MVYRVWVNLVRTGLLTLVLGASLAACSDDERAAPPNDGAGADDAEPTVDAGLGLDADSRADAALPEDGGTTEDAGEPGTWPIERVTVGSGRAQTDGGSFNLFLSPTGRFVLFRSRAASLLPAMSDAPVNVYLRDRQLDTTTIISLDNDGAPMGVLQDALAVSDDRSKVIFRSPYARFTPGGSSRPGIFLRDLTSDMTSIISRNDAGEQANGASYEAVMSGDGRYVAFVTDAINMGLGAGRRHVHLRDLVAASTTLMAQVGGEPANQATGQADISDDGSKIVFVSRATNLPMGSSTQQVYITDRTALVPAIVSVNDDGAPANAPASNPAISGDGRYVAFHSTATNLVPSASDGMPHVFLRDTVDGTTILVSVDEAGDPIGGTPAEKPGISDDGRYVSFSINDPGTPTDDNAAADVYRFDRVAGTSVRVSLTYQGAQPERSCLKSVMSGDGRVVGFTTVSPAMVADKTSPHEDGYVVTVPE